MCLVSRQLGFVISPKFSYYLVPRSTTSPLILSSLVREHPDIRRFAFFVSFFLPSSFFLSFLPRHRPHWVIRAPFSPQDPPATSSLLCNQRVSPTVSPTASRLSSPFNSSSHSNARVPRRKSRLGFNRSTTG